MIAKCSMHCGKKWDAAHNLREYDKDKWNKDNHISDDRTFLNQTLANQNLQTFFDEQFGDALTEANEKNRAKHPDRLIGFKSGEEYDSCPKKERRSRAVQAYYREHKKDVQETIIQLGKHENYVEMVEQYGRTKADNIYKDYLQQAYKEFVTQNPSLKVFCAVVHMDEIKEGTPHLHIDYLPVAESSRGMTRKVSMDGALKQLGFKREKEQKYAETPYKKWLKSRREGFEDFAQQYSNDHKLGIIIAPSEKCTAKHEEPQVWRERQNRVKHTNGKIAALKGKDKKEQIKAAEFIVSNSQAIAEGISATAAKEKEQATLEKLAAEYEKEGYHKAKISFEDAADRMKEREKSLKSEQEETAKARKTYEIKENQQDTVIRASVNQRLTRSERHNRLTAVPQARKNRLNQLGVTQNENINDLDTPERERKLAGLPQARRGRG